MLALRYASRWRAISIALLAIVMVGATLPVFWFFDDKRAALLWFENADKWVHGIGFALLTVWFSGLYARRAYWLIAVGLTGFGLLIEMTQRMISYRTADWMDVGANSVGIVAGLIIALIGLGGWGPRLEAWYGERRAT